MENIRSAGSDGPRRFRLRRWLVLACLACLLCLLPSAAGVCAPAGPDASSGRRIKVRVQPEYPELAKRLNIRGIVRVQLLVAADGHIRSTKVLGGSPLLIQAVMEALRKWKYEPAPAESTEIVRFDFDPLNGSR
jgi:TonB family protein